MLCCYLFTFPIRDGGLGRSPSRRASGGITFGKLFWNSLRDLVHFCAVWWQLFVGRRSRYICNFAIKIEPICQLQCPYDCTAVLLLLSNEHALKSGTFGVPGLVLLGRGTTRHKSGKSGTGGNPSCSWLCLHTVENDLDFGHITWQSACEQLG